jgi:tetratricopeptide (TPR) repeat protein
MRSSEAGIRRRAPICAALIAGVLTAAWAAPLRAEPTPTELAVARRLFAEALELEREQRWELAASKLRDALAVKDTPGLRFHLAHCEEKRGRLVEAMLNYDRARELIAAGAKAPDVESVLEPARSALERRLPVLVLVPPADVADLSVQLDGQPVARSVLGRAAPVDAGTHVIVARAPGYREYQQEVPIAEGERRTLQLALVPIPVAEPAPVASKPAAPPAAATSSSSPVRTYVLIGEAALTAAALGVGIGYYLGLDSAELRADEARDKVDAALPPMQYCPGGAPRECAEFDAAVEDYDRHRWFAVGGFTVAGVGAVATVLTYVLWPTNDVAPAASTGKNGTWVGLSGRF